MLMCLPHIRNSSRQRAMYIVCVFFVFSYIAFDVLDLDGSNLPKVFNPVQGTKIVAAVLTEARLDFSPKKLESRGDGVIFFADGSREYGRPRWAEISNLAPLGQARTHGYRVGLARNSLPGSSPYF